MKIFSGVRPTGNIHIGNYLGSMLQWIDLQKKNDCIFSIVDLHAITTPYDKDTLQRKIFEQAVLYLSIGIDPEKCIFFVQSKVKEHAELTWLLGTIISYGDLTRMTQFKDKSKQHSGAITGALLNYPILMAADILLYKAEGVPIGKDQKQHLELARNTAEKFNKEYGETFPIPEAIIPNQGAKIMSLINPEKKMSKTGDQKGAIQVFDTPDDIRKKIMSATTDSESIIKYDEENKKGISNLLIIYSKFSGKEIKELEDTYQGKNYGEFKKDLAELLIIKLGEIKEKRDNYYKNPDYVYSILENGRKKAEEIAEHTIKEVKEKMGI